MTESTDPNESRHHDVDTGPTQDIDPQRWRNPTAGSAPKPPWYMTAEAETRVQTRGRWLIICGIALGAMTVFISVVWRLGLGGPMFIEISIPLWAISVGAVSVGCVEYLNRGARYTHARNAELVRQVERGLIRLVGLMSEELQHRFYRGAADLARAQSRRTGTDDVRPAGRHNVEVVDFRSRRNDPPV